MTWIQFDLWMKKFLSDFNIFQSNFRLLNHFYIKIKGLNNYNYILFIFLNKSKWDIYYRMCFYSHKTRKSVWSHPATHAASVGRRIPRCTRLSLVGNILRRRRHSNRDIFEGICLCYTSSTIVMSEVSLVVVV